jgi:hypothetical protein
MDPINNPNDYTVEELTYKLETIIKNKLLVWKFVNKFI